MTVFPTRPSLPVTSPTCSQRIQGNKAPLTVPGVPGVPKVPGDDHHRRGGRARPVAGRDADLVRAAVETEFCAVGRRGDGKELGAGGCVQEFCGYGVELDLPMGLRPGQWLQTWTLISKWASLWKEFAH